MPSLDHQRLLIRAAQLYYLDDLTQAEVATRLRLSRPKVQRLLQQARDEGTVQIAIRPVLGIYADLERALEARYGLREALVVETTAYDDQSIVAREVGAAAAAYLLRVVGPHERIVISWGGTLLGLVNALAAQDSPALQGVRVIQGLGGLVDPNHEAHAADLTRRLARSLGGSAHLMPAPGVVGSRRTRQAVLHDPHVAAALDEARHATLALMGIGAPRPDSILVQQGTIVTWTELHVLQQRGAVGDLNLRYFDASGRPLASDLDERVIGLTLAELQAIPHVVGLAGGRAKLNAIRGALAGHLVHALVTDHITAQQLLEPASLSSRHNGHGSSRARARSPRRAT